MATYRCSPTRSGHMLATALAITIAVVLAGRVTASRKIFILSGESCGSKTLSEFQKIVGGQYNTDYTAKCVAGDEKALPGGAAKKCWECANDASVRSFTFFDSQSSPNQLNAANENCGQLKEGLCAFEDTNNDGIKEAFCKNPAPVPNVNCNIVNNLRDQITNEPFPLPGGPS